MPQISIIVPVFNAERYLDKTILSLRNQLLEDIEIIAVDDFSEDKSLNILLKHAKEDERVKIITFDENKSSNQARKSGVMAAKGKYIMFVDADDMLEEKACSYLLSEMNAANVDVLHFGCEIINCNGADKHTIEYLTRDAIPDNKIIVNQDSLIKHWFSRQRAGLIWAKLFNANLTKKAFEQIEDIILQRAQDLYAIFIIMYYAKSYKGLSEQQFKFYKYYYGRGGFGKTKEDFDFFEKLCSTADVAEAIRQFLIRESTFKNYEEYYEKVKNHLFNGVYSRYNGVTESEKIKYLDSMVKYWGEGFIIANFAKTKWYNRLEVAKSLKNAAFLNSKKNKTIKTIGAFYHSIYNGGAQRVCADLCELWLKMGYNVVLFTDSEPTEDDYYISGSVVRIILPNVTYIQEKYVVRMNALLDAIETYNIDVFVYHAWLSSTMLWDLLTAKSAGVNFILHCHNIFSMLNISAREQFYELSKLLSLSDCVVVLSRVDYTYWSAYCDNVKIIQNPLTFNIDDINISHLNSNIILWIARLNSEKKPEDALAILKLVAEKIPEVKLQLVGDSNTDVNYKKRLMKYAEDNNLTENVEFVGFTTEVTEYYKNADVKLMTSKYEGSPLTLPEAMMHGLPIVCYDMPYLEMLRRYDKGMIKVPQGDIAAAADAIIEILSDSNKKAEMGMASQIAAEEMAEYDFKGTWQDIFDSVTEGKESKPQYIPTEEDRKIMLQTLDEHNENVYYKLRANQANITKLQKEIQELKQKQVK